MDRIVLISYKGKKKKFIKSLYDRYLAKSQFVNCDAKKKEFLYVNFRGSIFKGVNFQNSLIKGCDFWGTTFRNCDFRNVTIDGCVFMACKFYNCKFSGASIVFTTIVNTSLSACHDIKISTNSKVYKSYPQVIISKEMQSVIDSLKINKIIRKTKILYLSDSKYNHLNLFLLYKKFSENIIVLFLSQLNYNSSRQINTYKKLELSLRNFYKNSII